jgi:hypothetical protein
MRQRASRGYSIDVRPPLRISTFSPPLLITRKVATNRAIASSFGAKDLKIVWGWMGKVAQYFDQRQDRFRGIYSFLVPEKDKPHPPSTLEVHEPLPANAIFD